MRRLDLLITQSRRSTENLDFSDDAGIQDDELIQYFNDGQDELYGMVINAFPDMYQKEKVYDVISGQEQYEIPWDCYIGERVEMVEYSRTGQNKDYYLLKKGDKRERLNGSSGNPSFYIRRSGSLYIQPVPIAAGTLRVLYQKALPSLDVRRGRVLSVTLTGSQITALNLDPSESIDAQSIIDYGYITVVDNVGTQKMRCIPVDAVDSSTGAVTVSAGFEFEAGETITIGNYVCLGKDSTTHSILPDPFENYLLEYANRRTLMRDSSIDSGELKELLAQFEQGILRTVQEPDGDINSVAIIDTQYLSYGDDY